MNSRLRLNLNPVYHITFIGPFFRGNMQVNQMRFLSFLVSNSPPPLDSWSAVREQSSNTYLNYNKLYVHVDYYTASTDRLLILLLVLTGLFAINQCQLCHVRLFISGLITYGTIDLTSFKLIYLDWLYLFIRQYPNRTIFLFCFFQSIFRASFFVLIGGISFSLSYKILWHIPLFLLYRFLLRSFIRQER